MSEDQKPQPPCGHLNKNCRKCKYRYKKGDRSIVCPECGESRPCRTPRIKGKNACRMHGGKGGRPPGPKYVLGPNLSQKINRVLAHPELYDLATEMSALTNRTEDLLNMSESFDHSKWGQKVDAAINRAIGAVRHGQQSTTFEILNELKDMRREEVVNDNLWFEIRENIKLQNVLAQTRHRIMLETEQTISVLQVMEVIGQIQRIFFRVIRNPADRRWVIEEIRKFYGGSNGAK